MDPSNHPSAAAAPSQRFDGWVVYWICVALVGTACAIDPFADAAFDAPKRLLAMIAATAGGISLVLQARKLRISAWSRSGKAIVALVLLAALGLVVAAWQAPAAGDAWSALRVLAVFSLFPILGAAPALNGNAGAKVLHVAAFAVALNALLSLLQASGCELPIPIAQKGGRFPTGALLGNEGYVSLACALLAAALLPIVWQRAASRSRWPAVLLILLCVATILVNRQLTSAIALAAAAAVVLVVRLRRQRLVWLGVGLLFALIASALVPPLRDASWARLPLDIPAYQERTSFRLSAWAAALEMVQARPVSGHGPGSYALHAQEFRQQAELKLHQRLAPPPFANAFIYAHQDYLQLAAEAGLPTLALVLSALLGLIAGLLRLTRADDALEACMLLSLITAGAIAALAWFPMQIPFTAVVLLIACGRAWRLVARTAEPAS